MLRISHDRGHLAPVFASSRDVPRPAETAPWLPYGLSEEDYNSKVQFFVILILMAVCLGFAAVYLRDISNRVEQTMMTWNSVNDGLGDLRRRYDTEQLSALTTRA